MIGLLILLALFSQALTWLAPAPLLRPIIEDLKISLGSAGLIISIIALCISIFSLAGAFIAHRFGALRPMIAGAWCLAVGAVLSGYAPDFPGLLACRVLEGVGFGIMISPPGTLVMEWFDEREWPYVNMGIALSSYIGLTAVFSMTVPIYLALGSSWRAVLRDYGWWMVAVALAWSVLGRERDAARVRQAASQGGIHALLEVIRMRNVALITFGMFGGMWVFQLYTAFLPEFLQTYRGFSLIEAARLTAVLPLTGIFAAAGGGLGTAWLGLRKPFTWPIFLLATAGCFGAVTLAAPGAIRFSLVIFGIGAAGSLAPLTTLLMELPGMTPAKMGTGLALIWASGYAGAFVSPFLGGALADLVGLRAVMIGFLAFQLMPIIALYPVPETGPGRAQAQVASAA